MCSAGHNNYTIKAHVKNDCTKHTNTNHRQNITIETLIKLTKEYMLDQRTIQSGKPYNIYNLHFMVHLTLFKELRFIMKDDE